MAPGRGRGGARGGARGQGSRGGGGSESRGSGRGGRTTRGGAGGMGGAGSGRGSRGGGGGRGSRGGAFDPARGTVSIAGVELNWDLSGLEIQKGPTERFPDHPPPQAPRPTESEKALVKHYLDVRSTIHDGPFYTILNDGMESGLKRRDSERAPTEAALFNSFTDNQTYTSKYLKVRRRIPKLDTRPYVTHFFPAELRSLLDYVGPVKTEEGAEPVTKKRKYLKISRGNPVDRLNQYLAEQQQRADDEPDLDEHNPDEEDDDEKLDPDDDEDEEPDDDTVPSSGSEDEGDDYNAEQYFDNGEDDDVDDADPYENTYD